MARESRRVLMQELRDDPPAAIVVVKSDSLPYVTGRKADSLTVLAEFPKLEEFLEAGYNPRRRFEDLQVWLRR